MRFKEKLLLALEGSIPSKFFKYLPSGYSKIGDIAIVRLSKKLETYKHIIGSAILNIAKVNVVVNQKDTHGELRKPEIELLAGERRTTTLHKEFNTIFHIDIALITFSPGNKHERAKLIQIVKNQEQILDMFACIGNLSLPVAVNNETVNITAIEKNPVAYKLLKLNIKANSVEKRYEAVLGDNRTYTPHDCFDRVLMGGFNSDERQFEIAVKAICDEGWIHRHDIVLRNQLSMTEDFIRKKSIELGFIIKNLATRIVKKYSPSKYHICTDLYIKKHDPISL